jgi:type IV pilus assembly protein PilM
MANQPGVWGVDLGQCALKAIRLEEIDGQVTATAFDYVEHPKILSQPDADPEQLTREALEKFLSRNTLKGDTVAISVPGQSGLARFVKLPPVEEKKITDIVRFEAKQQIPFNLDEVVWDFQKITSGIVSDGFAMETEIGLFAMKRDMVSRYLGHFKEVNVEVHLVQMAPLALCNYVSYDLLKMNADGTGGEEHEGGGKKHCVVALDIGADSANLVITDGQKIIWQRPIPLGGNHFTRALTKDMKLTFAKAEHLKRNATKSPDLKKILASLKPVLNDFVGEVQRSLGYFTNTHRDAQIEYMVGLGNAFRLPGLQRFLAEKLQLDVRKLTSFERLAGDEVTSQPTYTDNIASLAVAYGLGLQGLKAARLQTNLLPPEIQVERMVRAKKPMAAAAAAAFLAGVGFLTLGYAMELRAYGSINDSGGKPSDTSNIVEKAKLDAAAKVKENNDLETKYKTLLGLVADEERQVRSLIAGKDERIDWMAVHRFVSEALPRKLNNDDLFMLNLAKKAEYWNEEAKNAHKMLENRLNSAKGPLGKEDIDDTYKHLAQINITGFDCRYTANMADCWATFKIDDKESVSVERRDSVRAPRKDKATDTVKPPDAKPGWLVELRGYTYNSGNRFFIIDGLIDNLAQLGGAKEAAPGGAAAPANAAAAADAPAKKEPVRGQISHVFLYKYLPVPSANNFALAASGELTNIAGGSTAGRGAGGLGGGNLASAMAGSIMSKGMGGGAGAGMAGGMMGLTGGAGAGGGSSPGMMANAPGGAGAGGGVGSAGTAKDFNSLISGRGSGGGELGAGAAGAAGNRLGGTPRGLGDGERTTTNQAAPAETKEKPPRYEFVVLFFWSEDVPSDKLMGFNAPDPTASSQQSSGGASGGAGLPGKGAGK